MDQAVALSATGLFRNQGQVCCAATRMFVQESVYDEFAEKIAKKAEEINLGAPLDRATTMGPLVSSEQHARVLGYLQTRQRRRRQSQGRRPTGSAGEKLFRQADDLYRCEERHADRARGDLRPGRG